MANDNDDDAFQIDSINPDDKPPKAAKGASAADLTAAQAEAEKWKNDFLYLKADFENYKKGVIKERSELIKYGSERLLVALLDVLDNFDRALQVELNPENIPVYKEGINLTAAELRKVLANFGLSEVPSEGKPFDPSLHEALSSEETSAVEPGHICRVFKKAFKLHDRVIRPAQVVVAKPPKPAAE